MNFQSIGRLYTPLKPIGLMAARLVVLQLKPANQACGSDLRIRPADQPVRTEADPDAEQSPGRRRWRGP